MRFEWDADKAATNAKKHRISFDEAVTIFYDPLIGNVRRSRSFGGRASLHHHWVFGTKSSAGRLSRRARRDDEDHRRASSDDR